MNYNNIGNSCCIKSKKYSINSAPPPGIVLENFDLIQPNNTISTIKDIFELSFSLTENFSKKNVNDQIS